MLNFPGQLGRDGTQERVENLRLDRLIAEITPEMMGKLTLNEALVLGSMRALLRCTLLYSRAKIGLGRVSDASVMKYS